MRRAWKHVAPWHDETEAASIGYGWRRFSRSARRVSTSRRRHRMSISLNIKEILPFVMGRPSEPACFNIPFVFAIWWIEIYHDFSFRKISGLSFPNSIWAAYYLAVPFLWEHRTRICKATGSIIMHAHEPFRSIIMHAHEPCSEPWPSRRVLRSSPLECPVNHCLIFHNLSGTSWRFTPSSLLSRTSPPPFAFLAYASEPSSPKILRQGVGKTTGA